MTCYVRAPDVWEGGREGAQRALR